MHDAFKGADSVMTANGHPERCNGRAYADAFKEVLSNLN